MSKRWLTGSVLLFLGITFISWSIFAKVLLPSTTSLFSPFPTTHHLSQNPPPTTHHKIVFGFLPYWNLKYEQFVRYDLLTHIAFFGFDVTPDGSIKTHTNDGYEEPGWTAYQSSTFGAMVRQAHDHQTKIVLVLRAFDNDTIESILLNSQNRQRLIDETMEIVELKNLDGVNIDFEYVDSPPEIVRRRFVEFIKDLRLACFESLAGCHISVDAYADAAQEQRLWDLAALTPHLDQLVVMAYDFTRPGSDYSGPVAPLHQIKESISAYTNHVPPEKMLLGIAYYGYEWPTYSNQPMSKTKDRGYLASYQRIKELVLGTAAQLGWDEESFTPYLISTESGQTTQIFYDDTRSLSLKYDFVNESDLSGVAIWALGYDGKNPELWNLLEEKFPQ